MPAVARSQIAVFAPSRAPVLGQRKFAAPRRAPSPGRGQTIAAVAAALLCVWTAYADPVARAAARAVLRPLLSAVLAVEPEVKIGEIAARRGTLDGQTILYVEGSLRNSTDHALKTPTLTVALLGEDGRPLYTWKAKPTEPKIQAAGEATFRTRLLSPPETFKSVAVSVADER